MWTEVRICFDCKNIPGGAGTVLDPAGCGTDVARVSETMVLRRRDVWVTLEEKDPRLSILLELLVRHGVDWSEDHVDRHTEEELDTARLLVMHPNRQCEISGGVAWGMTYDLAGACSACGTGARQTSALLVDGEELSELNGHRAGATVFFHLLVEDGLAEELLRIGPSGLSSRSVYAVMPDRRQIKLRWKQLCADRVLPRMSSRTSGLVRDQVCEICQRNGYFQTARLPTRISYKASDLRDIDDVNMSWENLGYAALKPDLRESLLSYPWTLVTPKVRRVFRDAGVTSFDWLPVRVEEDAA
jgi:hypothetical protein